VERKWKSNYVRITRKTGLGRNTGKKRKIHKYKAVFNKCLFEYSDGLPLFILYYLLTLHCYVLSFKCTSHVASKNLEVTN
jgi:hypothetical protein